MLRRQCQYLYAVISLGLLSVIFPAAAMQISNAQRQEFIREFAALREKDQLELLFQSSPSLESDATIYHEITSAEEISLAIMLEKLLNKVDNAAFFAKYFEESLVAIPEFNDFLLSSIAAIKVIPPLTDLLTKREMEFCTVKINFIFLSKFMRSYTITEDPANKSRLARAFSKMYFVSLINLMYTQSCLKEDDTYFPRCIESYKVKSIGLVNFLLKSKNIERAFSYIWHHSISHESLAGSDYLQILHALRSDYNQHHTYFMQQINAQVYNRFYASRKRRNLLPDSLENSSSASISPISSAGPSTPASFSGSSSPASSYAGSCSPFSSSSLNASPISLPLTPDNYNSSDPIFDQPLNVKSVDYEVFTGYGRTRAQNGLTFTEIMPGLIEVKYKAIVFYYNQRTKHSFFGDPTQAKPASALQRHNMEVILKYLSDLYYQNHIKEDQFTAARSYLGIINTAIKENAQICQDIFSQFKATGQPELRYSWENTIVINCEERTELVQERTHAIYMELIKCFQLALRNGLMVEFFTQAFERNKSPNYHLGFIRQDLNVWYETAKHMLMQREMETRELARKVFMSRSFTKIIEKIKQTRPFKIFDYQTYETYLNQPGLLLPPRESHKLEADKKFYAEIASEVKGRVFEEVIALCLDITVADIDTYWNQYCKIKS